MHAACRREPLGDGCDADALKAAWKSGIKTTTLRRGGARMNPNAKGGSESASAHSGGRARASCLRGACAPGWRTRASLRMMPACLATQPRWQGRANALESRVWSETHSARLDTHGSCVRFMTVCRFCSKVTSKEGKEFVCLHVDRWNQPFLGWFLETK